MGYYVFLLNFPAGKKIIPDFKNNYPKGSFASQTKDKLKC